MSTRVPYIQRGTVQNAGPPGSVVKISGANFVNVNETTQDIWVWWEWQRTFQAVSPSNIPTWAGVMGFCIVNAGDTVPDPSTAPNDPRWLYWRPVSGDTTDRPTWWNTSTSQPFLWVVNHQDGILLKTGRRITSGNAALWWSWNIGSTPASTDRVSFGWVAVSLLA